MRILLDTSVMVRLGSEATPLGVSVREAIINADEILVSPIARAEIGIKLSIGKLQLPTLEAAFWDGITTRLQASELRFATSHAAMLSSLPFLHRDPFDRMIIAQCLVEDIFLATTDFIFKQYGVKTID